MEGQVKKPKSKKPTPKVKKPTVLEEVGKMLDSITANIGNRLNALEDSVWKLNRKNDQNQEQNMWVLPPLNMNTVEFMELKAQLAVKEAETAQLVERLNRTARK